MRLASPISLVALLLATSGCRQLLGLEDLPRRDAPLPDIAAPPDTAGCTLVAVYLTTTGVGTWTNTTGCSKFQIEAIGGGGNGSAGQSGAGGSGGCYAKTTSITIGASAFYTVGAAASDSWLNPTSNAAPVSPSDGVLAGAGVTATSSTGVEACSSASSVGNIINAGGRTGNGSANGATGGGGAGGPNGVGGSSLGHGGTIAAGTGGGGNGGGSDGVANSSGTGGDGGGNSGGTGQGTGGTSSVAATAGTNGAGGGGAGNGMIPTFTTGGDGGSGTDFADGVHGSGGGGGGAKSSVSGAGGGNGGLYGGGGGGGCNSSPANCLGAQGIIVITPIS